MSTIFVKAHRRAGKVVQAYSRSGRSRLQGEKALRRIANAIKAKGKSKKKSRYGVSTGFTSAALKAARPYEVAAAILKAEADVKRVRGRGILNRSLMLGQRTGTRIHGSTRFQTTDLSQVEYGSSWVQRAASQREIRVAGPVSSYPRGTKIDYKAMVDPWGRFHNLKPPRRRR